MKKPIITIGVATYNSSQYVIETLESIKAQTYPNIILQISDDCSTDNTIEVCKNWIEENKDRFVKTKIIVPEHNTGISGNANRNWDACETEWFKGIAGDDLLLPNCIEDNVNYANEHQDAIFIFSKPKPFGVGEKECNEYMKKFDYSVFSMNSEQQYDRIKYSNCIPAASVFCNIGKIREIGLRHDERIPFMEDKPKWLTAARMGIKFHFFDKETVAYRIRRDSLSSSRVAPPAFYESYRLCYYYYVFQPLYEKCPENAIHETIKEEMSLYKKYISCKAQLDHINNNPIIRFLRRLKKLF